jgi:hypothetical protein
MTWLDWVPDWVPPALAILGVVLVGWGTYRLWHLDPSDPRYRIRGAAVLQGKDQPGLANFLDDQRRALAWVLAGTVLQFLAVFSSALIES